MNAIKFNSLVVISITILFFSCRTDSSLKNENLDIKQEKIKNDIVLIFRDIPNNWELIHPKGGSYNKGVYEISYSLNNHQFVEWTPKNHANGYDTLVIKDVDSNLEINHKYRALDELSYVFNSGDTIIFNYNDNLPIVKVKNRKVKKYDYNFESFIKQKSLKNVVPHYIRLFNLPYIEVVNMLDGIPSTRDNLIKNLTDTSKFQLQTHKLVLDSLFDENSISKENYIYYRDKITYQQNQIELINNDLKKISTTKENDKELLKYKYFKNYLKQYLQQKYYQNEFIKLKQSRVPDYRIIYDSLILNKQLTIAAKKYLLYNNMINLIKQSSAKDIKQYFDLYTQSKFSDSLSVTLIKKEFNIGEEISNDLFLVKSNNKETSFTELLKKHKGKTIYMDFWASWCRPCRAAMPASRKLRNELKGDDVIFIYLALNDKYEKWLNASEKEFLSDYSENYFIKNSKSTNFIENHKIHAIPRYMIFDAEGKMKFSNAPSPNDSRVKKAILD